MSRLHLRPTVSVLGFFFPPKVIYLRGKKYSKIIRLAVLNNNFTFLDQY